MKKMISLLLALTLLFCHLLAVAEDLGVQPIGGPDVVLEEDSLDDVQLGNTYTMNGYADIRLVESSFYDYFAQFGEKEDYGTWSGGTDSIYQVYSYMNSGFGWSSTRFKDASWMESGNSAQFLWIVTDITNRQMVEVDFTQEIEIKVVYNDIYEFKGWIRQIDNDRIPRDQSDYGVSRFYGDKADYPNMIVLNPLTNAPIQMMYTGNYIIGCTLPNAVVEDKKTPLRVEVKLCEFELTYNFRK